MFTKFWEGVAEGLAGEWTSRLIGPALVFWGGGLLAWVYCYGWSTLFDWLTVLNTADYLILATGGVLLLAVSTTAMTWIQLPLLHLLEGYWPGPGRRLRFALARRIAKRLKKKEERWQELAERNLVALSPQEREDYARLDAELASYPVDQGDILPTLLGNLLRSAEIYPRLYYGLETNIVWPRLWLTLPEETQREISSARERLNSATSLFGWGILFTVWAGWAWWALPIAAVIATVAWWRMINAAGVYGELLRAAFDMHRFALFEQLHWPLPTNSSDEKVQGERLTQYLLRGELETPVVFQHSSK